MTMEQEEEKKQERRRRMMHYWMIWMMHYWIMMENAERVVDRVDSSFSSSSGEVRRVTGGLHLFS